jgi:ABC-type bacteriocin/lantibiotic exporter with double-glycine peptidase domain
MVGGLSNGKAIEQHNRRKNITAFKGTLTELKKKSRKGFIKEYIYTVFLGTLFITVLNMFMADRILIKSDLDLMYCICVIVFV